MLAPGGAGGTAHHAQPLQTGDLQNAIADEEPVVGQTLRQPGGFAGGGGGKGGGGGDGGAGGGLGGNGGAGFGGPVATSERSRGIVHAPRDSMPTVSRPRSMRNSPRVPGMPHEPHELMSFQYLTCWPLMVEVPQP